MFVDNLIGSIIGLRRPTVNDLIKIHKDILLSDGVLDNAQENEYLTLKNDEKTIYWVVSSIDKINLLGLVTVFAASTSRASISFSLVNNHSNKETLTELIVLVTNYLQYKKRIISVTVAIPKDNKIMNNIVEKLDFTLTNNEDNVYELNFL